MADTFSPEKRSEIMSRVRSKDTAPELRVRSALHGLGYRFRLHRADLPGKPDVVLPRHRKVIYVHGCFWHHHEGCRRSTLPASRPEFWREKIGKNVKRDADNVAKITDLGWTPVIVWECQTKRPEALNALLEEAMRPRPCPDQP